MKRRFITVILISTMMLAGVITYVWAEYGDIVLDNKIESMKKVGVNPVVFPHWFHRIRFKCKVCHPAIFIMRAGANDINMKKIMNGEKCGRCHNGIIAFAPLECEICHSKAPVAVPIQGVMK
ncbi:MAG: c(7)-type cytochrome triheme domain-containing protein [Nitrospirota bacterium]